MVSPSQTINITITPRPRRQRKLFLFSIFLVALCPLVWYIAVPEWDYYTSYSGVVVEKGMDCGLCFFSDSTGLELYIVLEDPQGKRSKRYVGSSNLYRRSERWTNLEVGTFVVKDKGYDELPYEPGRKPPSRPASRTSPWVFVGLFMVLAAVAFFRLRSLWREL